METLQDITNGFPLYYDKEKIYIYTENFHDYEDTEDPYYYIGYESLEKDWEFIVKFEWTKRECAERLQEYLKENPPTYIRYT